MANTTELIPTIQISDIPDTPTQYLIDQLWLEGSVGFISAQPGSYKSWLAADMALSVASGTPVLGQFSSQKGPVIFFNAEDDPSRVTKKRIQALAVAKQIDLSEIELYILKTDTLRLDDEETCLKLKATVKKIKPKLLILDPLRNLHLKNEDKSDEMLPILLFLRSLQHQYNCSVLLVCHEKKPNTARGERRESMTRGSNIIEGWRDTAIYLDRLVNHTKVKIYHRAAPMPNPFHFELKTDSSTELQEAELVYQGLVLDGVAKNAALKEKIALALKEKGPLDRAEIRAHLGINNKLSLELINQLINEGKIVAQLFGGTQKLILN